MLKYFALSVFAGCISACSIGDFSQTTFTTDILPNEIPQEFSTEVAYLAILRDSSGSFSPGFIPANSYSEYRDNYIDKLDAYDLSTMSSNRAAALRNEIVIRRYWATNSDNIDLAETSAGYDFIPLAPIRFETSAWCKRVVTGEVSYDDDGRQKIGTSNEFRFLKIGNVSETRYLVTTADRCTSVGDSGNFKVYLVDKNSSGAFIYTPFGDGNYREHAKFLDVTIADLNGIQRRIFGAQNNDISRFSTELQNSNTVHISGWMVNRLSFFKRFDTPKMDRNTNMDEWSEDDDSHVRLFVNMGAILVPSTELEGIRIARYLQITEETDDLIKDVISQNQQ